MKMTISIMDRIIRTALCGCVALAGSSLVAAEAAKAIAPAEEEDFANWVELGTGGMIYHGNTAAGRQQTGMAEGMFGGINDMHTEMSLGNKWFAKLDGRAIFGNNDYDLTLDISKADVGYIRGGYKEFRTYYDGLGGFYPNSALEGGGAIFAPHDAELAVDRGDVWAELGLRMPSLPEVTFRYDHIWRDGTKDSTLWGDTALTGGNLWTNNVRKIAPAFRTLNEKRDVFTLDVRQTFGNTDVGVGARAELTNNNDTVNELYRPGEYNPTAPYKDMHLDRYLTQRDTLKSDMFSTHATTETRFGEKLWLTAAYDFSTLNSDIGGSRIFGTGYDVPYAPLFGISGTRNPLFPYLPLAATSGATSTVGNIASTRAAVGYIDLLGGSELSRNEFNVNLMWIPAPDVSLIAGFRYDNEDIDSVSSFDETSLNASAKKYYISKGKSASVTYLQPTIDPYIASSSYSLQKLAENLELRYTGLTNWVFYTRCDLDEDVENTIQFRRNALLVQQYVADPISGKPVPSIKTASSISSGTTTLKSSEDSDRLSQKYTGGFNWYPLPRLSFSAQYYHKSEDNNYASEDPYFTGQDFVTDNVNFRVTVRPLMNLSMVSRYDFQQVRSYLAAEGFGPQQCATQTSNMFNECITWNPLDRLYLQGNASYVRNTTDTDASFTIQDPTYHLVNATTGAVTIPTYAPGNPLRTSGFSFRNNFWMAGIGAGFAFNDKTDLRADYNYYRANDYSNNDLFGNGALIGQPYGAGQEEQTVSASLQRQLCRNARLTLKYTYFVNRDQTFGGYGNFTGQLISTSVLVRF